MPADPRRVKDLFAAAADLTAADRPAFLDRECGADSDLRRRVEQLLHAHDRPASALERPFALPDYLGTRAYAPGDQTVDRPTDSTAGDRVGPYKLLEKIGEGGMGEVWVADQLEPIKRRVAVKLIKPGMDSRSVLGRFEAERQALAMMNHPNIAQVLDANTTGDGRPYFVMELVKGTPITEFADARKLTPKQRLELFVPVCQAIQHAHMKGIIHRDIKPGNVLVELHDDRMVPKVIDFGVAKAVGQQLTERTVYTGFGALVGTPAYMAPEQATFNAMDVDTRADVYALGVLLYELLAGSPPIEKERLRKVALDEVLRIVREEEPPRPSQRLSTADTRASIAAVRGTEPAKLSALMKGELDWIVMKALEKDRARRYETANGFAADLQRYLSGEPVQAVPPSVGYRLLKVWRKNRTAGLVACAFVALICGAAAVAILLAVQAIRAEQAAVDERDKADRERAVAVDAKSEAEAARRAAERRQAAAAIDLDLKYCETEPSRGILRLAQRLKSLPADATELRQFVTLSLFAHAQKQARLVPFKEPLDAVSPDGQVGYRRRPDGPAELVHPLTGARLALLADTLSGGEFRFSPDGRQGALVAGGEVRVFDLRTFRQTATFRPGGPPGWSVSLDPTFTRAVVWRQEWVEGGQHSARIDYHLWDVPAGRRLAALHRVERSPTRGEYLQMEDLCVFSPDGRTVLTVGDGPPRVWAVDDGRLLHTLTGHTADARFAAFGPDGTTAATGSGREVCWWRTADWQPDGPPTQQAIESIWNPDGTPDPHLWPQGRMLADGVLAVAVRNSDDSRDGSADYLFVRGERSAPRTRAVASDGRVAVDFDKAYHLRPFRELDSADGRRFPADYRGPLTDGRFLRLRSDLLPFNVREALIDLACDRPVGGWFAGVVPCAAGGGRFVAPQELSAGWNTGRWTVVLPSAGVPFDPDMLDLWAKVLTCGGLNPTTGFFEPHDEGTWERNRQELLRWPKPHAEFPFPGAFAADRLHWLRRQQVRTDPKLLDRLVAEEPTAVNYRERAYYWYNFRRFDLAIKDDLAADAVDVREGVPAANRETSTTTAENILYAPDRPRAEYELALQWLDSRPTRDRLADLRGLALHRLGRHQEAIDMLLDDERTQSRHLSALAGGTAVLRPNEARHLTLGLCLLALGKVREATARLEQARDEHLTREQTYERWGRGIDQLPRGFLMEAEDTILDKSKPREASK